MQQDMQAEHKVAAAVRAASRRAEAQLLQARQVSLMLLPVNAIARLRACLQRQLLLEELKYGGLLTLRRSHVVFEG